MIYHSNIRWLSLGNVLRRVWLLKNEIILFLESKNNHDFPELTDSIWLADLAFALDMLKCFNTSNLMLQSKGLYVYELINGLNAFNDKVNIPLRHLNDRNFAHFKMLIEFSSNTSDENWSIICQI